jgi:hypothetical protein
VKQALRQLLGDFLSAILFLVVYALSGDFITWAWSISVGAVGGKLVAFTL